MYQAVPPWGFLIHETQKWRDQGPSWRATAGGPHCGTPRLTLTKPQRDKITRVMYRAFGMSAVWCCEHQLGNEHSQVWEGLEDPPHGGHGDTMMVRGWVSTQGSPEFRPAHAMATPRVGVTVTSTHTYECIHPQGPPLQSDTAGRLKQQTL